MKGIDPFFSFHIHLDISVTARTKPLFLIPGKNSFLWTRLPDILLGVQDTLLRRHVASKMSRMAQAGEDNELRHLRITGLEAARSILGACGCVSNLESW